MKTSELIARLQVEMEVNGDREIIVFTEGQRADVSAHNIKSVDGSEHFPRATLIDLDGD